jgi:hypothetical protein
MTLRALGRDKDAISDQGVQVADRPHIMRLYGIHHTPISSFSKVRAKIFVFSKDKSNN